MKKNIIFIIFTTFLLTFISVAYAAFNRDLIITGEGIVETDTIAPTCGAWYLRDSSLTIQEAYNQNKFINPGTNTTWTNTDKKLFIECSDNMPGSYGCINVTEITDSNNQKRYFKEVKEYNTSIQTDPNVVSVTLQDAYLNSRTCTLPVGGSNPYLDKQAPILTIIQTAANKFTYSATDDIGVKGFMVTTTSTPPAINDPNWSNITSEITIDNTQQQIYYVWVKDEVNITSQTISTYLLTKTEGAGTNLSLKWNNSTGYELSTGYVLNGTNIHVTGTLKPGYNSLDLKKNTTNILSDTIQTINSNTSIISSSNVNTYTVKYNANGGNGSMSSQIMIYDVATTLLPNEFTYSFHSFVNWNTLPNGSGISYNDEQTVTNLCTENNCEFNLYAQWIYDVTPTINLIDYNTFSYGGGTAYFVSTTQTTAPAAGSTAASSTFALDEWTTATSTGDLILEADKTYYVWVKDSVNGGNVSPTSTTIQVRAIVRNVGTGTSLTTKLDNSSGTSFTDSTKYVLNGTNIYAVATANNGYSNPTINIIGGTISSNIIIVNNDITIDSSASPNIYTITLNSQSAATAGTQNIYEKYGVGYYLDNETTQHMTTQDYSITKPTKEGKMFGGYYTSTNCSGDLYINREGYLNDEVAETTHFSTSGTLYACWVQVRAVDLCYTPPTGVSCQDVQCMIDFLYNLRFNRESYILTYDNNGGNGCNSQTGIKDGQWGTLCTPTKTGHTFLRWQDENGNTITSTLIVSSNLTAYAVWQANTYTISFDANGGSGGQSTNVIATYGQAMPEISTTAPSRTGYTFKGWYDNTNYAASGSKQYYTASGVSARSFDRTSPTPFPLYAGWQGNQFNISYNGNENTGGSTASHNCTYGQSCSLSSNGFSKTGYTFAGWKKNNTGSTMSAGSSIANISTGDPVTFYAQWSANTYTLTLNPNGGSYSGTTGNTNKTMTYGTKNNNSIGTASKSSYVFLGWYTAASGGSQVFNASGQNVNNSTYWTAAYSNGTWKYTGNVTLYAHWANRTTETYSNPGNYSYTVPQTGTYKLEAWGAQGGSVGSAYGSMTGGYGGYATGTISLNAGDVIYIFVGGQGTGIAGGPGVYPSKASGGYNGGGDTADATLSGQALGSGGGATHISKTNTYIENTTNANLLVVGGGGGGANLYINSGRINFGGNGGSGGGQNGGTGAAYSDDGTFYGSGGDGGTQSTPASAASKGHGAVGGGGGYYGGGGCYPNVGLIGSNPAAAGNGGGSGYINSSLGNRSWSNGRKTGNGQAKISKQ